MFNNVGQIAKTYGQTVQGTGCAVWVGTSCHSNFKISSIQMKNCGSYNVYYLKPTQCNIAYCVGTYILVHIMLFTESF